MIGNPTCVIQIVSRPLKGDSHCAIVVQTKFPVPNSLKIRTSPNDYRKIHARHNFEQWIVV